MRITSQSKLWGVNMSEKDEEFYSNMCTVPPTGYCSSFTDRKWKKTEKRKREEEQMMQRKRMESDKQIAANLTSVDFSETYDTAIDENMDIDDYDYEEIEVNDKYAFEEVIDDPNDELPHKYRHARDGLRSVKPGYYVTMNRMKAELHMSEAQSQGAICIVFNEMLERNKYGKWKTYKQGQRVDSNTLPAKNNTLRNEEYIEALVLAGIVNEIMSPESDKTTITFSNDGSAQSGVGNYIVQSFFINGKQRALPTLPIFTESRASLTEMTLCILKILSAATGLKYTEQDIMERIDFVVTDSTEHNLGVIENVCKDLETESIPDSLVCHVHPMMMFQRKVKGVFQEIHDAFGTNAIKDCFITEVDFRHESFIYKAIGCLCSFINSEYSAKPWNRQQHFDVFIKPQKNESLSLKDHRFNRVFDCCLHILYHLDDIKLYLDTYSNVLNGIAIIDRGFLDMEILKPIFCAAALIGIHYTRPYLSLLLDTKTKYSTLIETFPLIYNDFLHVDKDKLLQADVKVINFVNQKKFENSLPKKCLRESVNNCATQYGKEVKKLLNIILPRLADGFSEQRGAIFGFGPKADEDTRSLLKVATADDETKMKLQEAPVHNLNEERSVGFVNYEIQIRGKKYLDVVSRKMVLNKSKDILQAANANDIKKYRKPANVIKEIKMEWSKRVLEHQQETYTEKEKACLKDESTKYQLLETLKGEEFPGPFVSEIEVREYMKKDIEEDLKVKRLYNEVRYARMSSMSLKPTAAVFRLKRNYKNLPSEEYAENLCSYLCSARSCKTITIDDLNNVMHGIASKDINTEDEVVMLEKETVEPGTSNQQRLEIPSIVEDDPSDYSFVIGEHIVAFWYENEKVKWHLGIVEEISNEIVKVSYMTRADQTGLSWTFPESAEILDTSFGQILASKVKVQYLGTVRIRCKIVDKILINKMNDIIQDKKKN